MNSARASEIQREPNPLMKANFISKWFFWWTYDVFKMGMRNDLRTDNIYEHVPYLDSKNVSRPLINYWESNERRRKKPNLLHMIFRVYGWRFVPICIVYSILEIALHTFQPLFLGGLISYFAEGQTDITKQAAYLYAMGIVLCTFVLSMCFHPFMFYVFEIGTRIRLACAGLMYNKSLSASVTADNSGLSGFAISLLANDLPQFDLTFYFFHDLWKGPVEACLFGYIMYQELQWAAIIGIAVIAIFIPLQAWAAKAAATFRTRSAGHCDERVKLMNEIITAIQVIKMYAWEKSFSKLVTNVRKNEIKAIRGSMNIYAALQCTNMISKLALFASLVTYAFTGDAVTARKVFITSSYYDALNDSLLHFWPLAITTWAETVVCSRRIVKYLLQSETDTECAGIDNYAFILDNKLSNEPPKSDNLNANFETNTKRIHEERGTSKGIKFRGVWASWHKSKNIQKQTVHLRNLNFSIESSQFVAIVGDVGSSKTTLLNAILGEVNIIQGNARVNGSISYTPQEAWIFEGSIRDNITFIEPYDEVRYKAVIQACQLERDIQLFTAGDATVVGERGISLSGGQKARISLARAVYRQADIYLFDDPLAAVDASVGRKLVRDCFMKFLNGKIRVLVTHQVQHLQNCDHIIVMTNDGSIAMQGPFDEKLKETLHERMLLSADSMAKRTSLNQSNSVVDDNTTNDEFKNKLADSQESRREQQLQGSVKFKTYLQYFRTFGMSWVAIMVLLLFLIARTSQALMDVFVSKWSTWEESISTQNATSTNYSTKREKVVVIYSVLVVCTLIFYLLRTFGFFWMCLRISLRLHDKLFNGIIRALMQFFHTNPSGRILNRFSSDVNKVDVALPQAMLDSLNFLVNALAVLVIVATTNVWLLIPAAIVVIALDVVRRIYIRASRSLKRIESITRSPIYSHTNQTFQGLTTIRALNATSQLEDEFHAYQNVNTSALHLYTTTNRAFAFWTDIICGIYIALVAFSFLVINGNFYSGDVGLAITQSMSLVIMCQWGMRQISEMENNMTSVERIIEYIEVPNEPPLETDKNIGLPAEWPSEAKITFDKLSLRYSAKEDRVLNELTFAIMPTEKIGIVGRTGAGKSSIIQAIFRLAYNDGLIEIDHFDIATLGLHDLRSRISIIPQEPVLFTGTLRYNLDPFEQCSDEDMWKALDDVKLRQYIQTLDGGLDYKLSDGGSNFSMGQRQLVCLARAILKRNKILIMDEATANVDPGTDALIQQTLHTKFKHCTVLTIAHRLHTVMGNDRILVMDAGCVAESGHPYELLQNKSGYLYKLVEQTGSGTSHALRQIARESFEKRQHLSS